MAMQGSVLGADQYFIVNEDFLLDAGDTLPAPWATADTSLNGSPTLDYVANAKGGQFNMLHDSQSEQQLVTLYFGDDVYIDPTKQPVFECRLQINHDGSTTNFTADQRLAFGLGSARSDTLDSVADHCWFLIEGANNNVQIEGDDGTTDTNNLDTTIDYEDSTFHTYVIDMTDLAAVRFMVDGVQATSTIDVSAMAAGDHLQPLFELQRDLGAEEDSVLIDYCRVRVNR